jgi:dihydrofolate reductase
MITAMDRFGLIGKDGDLPWHIPEDLKYFNKVTTGHIVVMGSKTFESLPKKPLSNRINVVMTRDKDKYWFNRDILCSQTVESILEWATEEDVFIIGGAEIYKRFYRYCDKLYITYVKGEYKGNVYFPIKITQINEDFDLESRKITDKCEYLVMGRKRND